MKCTPPKPSYVEENVAHSVTLLKWLICIAIGVVLVSWTTIALLVLLHFPWNTDEPSVSKLLAPSRKYYEQAYTPGDTKIRYASADEKLPSQSPQFGPISEFVKRYGLQNKRVLEVGAGAGALQDIVEHYVGLDIAESARANFHKPFVQGSATDLPFANSQFDLIWTVWTLEHVPNPEMALSEMRRVVTDNGYLYIEPAWDVPAWRSRGYDLLPYSQLGLAGKIFRSWVIPIENSLPYIALYRIPTP